MKQYNWEEEFNKKFVVWEGNTQRELWAFPNNQLVLPPEVKLFIKDLLTSTRNELLKEIEEKLPKERTGITSVATIHGNYPTEGGFEQCLSEVKSILNSIRN